MLCNPSWKWLDNVYGPSRPGFLKTMRLVRVFRFVMALRTQNLMALSFGNQVCFRCGILLDVASLLPGPGAKKSRGLGFEVGDWIWQHQECRTWQYRNFIILSAKHYVQSFP